MKHNLRGEWETIRERVPVPLPSLDITVNFGRGDVIVRRGHGGTCSVMVSNDPDISTGKCLPIIHIDGESHVVLPGILKPKGLTIPFGFQPQISYSTSDDPWRVSSRSLAYQGPDNLFVFNLPSAGMEAAPPLPIKQIEMHETEDPREDDPNYVWFVIDGDQECWRGTSNHQEGMVYLDRVPSYEHKYLPESIREACGMEPMKPHWQTEAEAAGWKSPDEVGSSEESEE
jgi:hypothetical protein